LASPDVTNLRHPEEPTRSPVTRVAFDEQHTLGWPRGTNEGGF
jgi:hypothetical protein